MSKKPKKTKNYIKYKKVYAVDVDGKAWAPYLVRVRYDALSSCYCLCEDCEVCNGGITNNLKLKLIDLAKRNTGLTTDAVENSVECLIEFEFFTTKGVKQFFKKVKSRYNVDFEVKRALVSYQEVEFRA